jgi:hypothetical protein
MLTRYIKYSSKICVSKLDSFANMGNCVLVSTNGIYRRLWYGRFVWACVSSKHSTQKAIGLDHHWGGLVTFGSSFRCFLLFGEFESSYFRPPHDPLEI